MASVLALARIEIHEGWVSLFGRDRSDTETTTYEALYKISNTFVLSSDGLFGYPIENGLVNFDCNFVNLPKVSKIQKQVSKAAAFEQ